jgi:hypothetical protein
MAGIELYDISGKQVWSLRDLKAGESFRVPASVRTGALKYRWLAAGL